MRDSDVLEPFGLQEVFADSLGNITIINGVFHCTLYALQEIDGALTKVGVIRVAMPVSSVPNVAAMALQAIASTSPSLLS